MRQDGAFRVRKLLSMGSFLMEKIVFGNPFFKYLTHYDHQSCMGVDPPFCSEPMQIAAVCAPSANDDTAQMFMQT